MSDIIQLLPDSVANQIAAGEVIQRPASVIKELVENAVDAGATHIDVIVVDAGRTTIKVIDNGKGMSETDARLAFERHATSKISNAADLFSLHTMGFRGEALASVAAVAQVELRTRRPDDEVGTHLAIASSKVTLQEPCSCPSGSNFAVENLFYNVPARRKFLKGNSTELKNIITAFERIVLVYPEVSFRLLSDDNELFNLKRGGLRQRIVDVMGKRINQMLLPINVETSLCRISGFVGKPESARKKNAAQYFFVNGRFMKHPYFGKAVMSAYERLVPEGEQVPYFIYFDVNPEDIDVNIHPTKTEIKFENEQSIWQILSAAVKEAIGMFNDVATIDFDTQGRPEIPVFGMSDNIIQAPKVQYNPSYNPFATSQQPQRQKSADSWEQLYDGLKKSAPAADENPLFPDEAETPSNTYIQESNAGDASETDPNGSNAFAEKSPAHYQYKGKYIMTAVKSGLMLIDQHRAHVRILYEQYLERLEKKYAQSQKTLFPEMLHLSPGDVTSLQRVMPEIADMGFELTDLGGGSYSINAVPAGLEGVNIPSLLQDMIASAGENATAVIDDINRSLALSMARHAAITYGCVLDNAEMEEIVNSLFACSNFNYTPDGKIVLCILKQTEIERLFG